MSAEDEEQMLSYSSSLNVTFSGTVSTGYTKAEWSALTEKDREQAIDDIVYGRLIDVSEVED